MISEKIKLLSDRMSEAVETHETAGVSLLFQEKDEEPVFLSKGLADLKTGRPMSRDTIFSMYSQTKPVTSAAAMLLLQDGRIDLYEPVASYIPSFENQKICTDRDPIPAGRPVTIRDLLNMTSGLVYPGPHSQAETETGEVYDELIRRLDTDHPMTTQEFASRIGECPLQFEPGSGWKYGTSADILGAVIEKVSDMPLDEFMKTRLFLPLGMYDTDFRVPEEKRGRFATACQVSGNTLPGQKPELTVYTQNHLGIRRDGKQNAFLSGGAGLFSTLDDYLRFAKMLRSGGKSADGETILREGTVRFMTSRQLTPVQQTYFNRWVGLDGHSYGNLMRVLQDEKQAGIIGDAGEYGWDGWLGTYFANDPKRDATLLLGIQRRDYGTGPLTRKLRNIVFS